MAVENPSAKRLHAASQTIVTPGSRKQMTTEGAHEVQAARGVVTRSPRRLVDILSSTLPHYIFRCTRPRVPNRQLRPFVPAAVAYTIVSNIGDALHVHAVGFTLNNLKLANTFTARLGELP